ncbi:tetratricopeptide repeat protein 9C isoform X1 [Lagenorhynchus albirostris]|uniref:tetratricopeptide repeat protein 9C isoform X1 n=1 Tax=Lagenorhynchus albirostris TaxID=27610 RepID=UPI0028E5B459|nr:tetratricopeptide repeat protein 9C isoform X1 [Lagenorhynchus albirostris]
MSGAAAASPSGCLGCTDRIHLGSPTPGPEVNKCWLNKASVALSLPNSSRALGDKVMEKRLQEAQLYKEKGNQCYREGKYRDAVSGYHRALLQLRGLDPSLPSPIPNLGPQGPALTPEQENVLRTTQTDCYNNLAACLLQMEPVNYERVKEYSQKVLERQPDNAKALYRAGVAFFHLQDYDQARHYLMAAVNRQPKGEKNIVKRTTDSFLCWWFSTESCLPFCILA